MYALVRSGDCLPTASTTGRLFGSQSPPPETAVVPPIFGAFSTTSTSPGRAASAATSPAPPDPIQGGGRSILFRRRSRRCRRTASLSVRCTTPRRSGDTRRGTRIQRRIGDKQVEKRVPVLLVDAVAVSGAQFFQLLPAVSLLCTRARLPVLWRPARPCLRSRACRRRQRSRIRCGRSHPSQSDPRWPGRGSSCSG